MAPQIERRSLVLADAGVTLRAESAGGQRFTGHAAVFNSRTAIGDPFQWGFFEEIAPGAFSRSLVSGDPRFLIDHDSYYVVSRVSAGSLHLSEDSHGLAVDSVMDTNLTYVADLVANLRNGNITGMSFGFTVPEDGSIWTTEDVRDAAGGVVRVEVRTITEAELVEVSAVTFPAYQDTDAGLRGLVSWCAGRTAA